MNDEKKPKSEKARDKLFKLPKRRKTDKFSDSDAFALLVNNNRSTSCPSCHALVNASANYCGSCGEPITENRVAFLNKVLRNSKITVTVAVIVLTLVILASTIAVMRKMDKVSAGINLNRQQDSQALKDMKEHLGLELQHLEKLKEFQQKHHKEHLEIKEKISGN